jgi:hypothetical protein
MSGFLGLKSVTLHWFVLVGLQRGGEGLPLGEEIGPLIMVSEQLDRVTSILVVPYQSGIFSLEVFVFVTDSAYSKELALRPLGLARVLVCRGPVQV